jgi:hypothetical protein
MMVRWTTHATSKLLAELIKPTHMCGVLAARCPYTPPSNLARKIVATERMVAPTMHTFAIQWPSGVTRAGIRRAVAPRPGRIAAGSLRAGSLILACLAAYAFSSDALADTITFNGAIIQSTQDGTGPAVNNPSLNNILDGDTYAITLDFAGSITSPGTFDLTGAHLTFSDPAAPAGEAGFNSTSLTVTGNGSFDDISLLGCLTTGTGCIFGNELDANFRIPATGLNARAIPAQPISALFPLDLLEDDGATDIHGSVSAYSYLRESPVPEPSAILPVFSLWTLLTGVAGLRTWRTKQYTIGAE